MATVLTNTGEQTVCDFLSGVTAVAPDYIAWGTGAGTATKADTTLFTEAAEARVQGTKSTQGTLASAVYQVVGTMTSASGQTITNAGIFNASTSGNLFIKGDFTGIVLANGDKIEFTFTLDPS